MCMYVIFPSSCLGCAAWNVLPFMVKIFPTKVLHYISQIENILEYVKAEKGTWQKNYYQGLYVWDKSQLSHKSPPNSPECRDITKESMAKTNHKMNKTWSLELKVNNSLNSLANNPQCIQTRKNNMAKTNHKMNKTWRLDLKK